MTWLDPQTRALLQGAPPASGIAADVGEFTLILVARGGDRSRLAGAMGRVRGAGERETRALLEGPLPAVVATGLSLDDALLGQLDLICADATSVFVRDEVARDGDPGYLERLCRNLARSPEFATAEIVVRSVPPGEDGRRFLDRFLGSPEPLPLPLHAQVTVKKARIMRHWARLLGADVS